MKFRCERDTLTEAITSAQRAVTSRTGVLPVLSGLFMSADSGGIELVGSDLDLTIRVKIDADVEQTGNAVVSARLLSDIVKRLEPGAVVIDVTSDEARISSRRSEFTLRTLPVGEFPDLPEPELESVEIDGEQFAAAIRQVAPSSSKDEARPILTGVFLESTDDGLRLVATDSYRLAVRDLAGTRVLEPGKSVLVSAKALSELQRLVADGSLQVGFGNADASFQLGTTTILSRLIMGQFPAYQKLIPQNQPNRLVLDREALADAIRRVKTVAQGRDDIAVRIAMESGRIEMTATAADVGEARDELDADFTGEDTTVAFNPDFLLDGISAIDAERVVIETTDGMKPAVIKGENVSDFLYLLMPVRV